jgi:hypothetical protein
VQDVAPAGAGVTDIDAASVCALGIDQCGEYEDSPPTTFGLGSDDDGLCSPRSRQTSLTHRLPLQDLRPSAGTEAVSSNKETTGRTAPGATQCCASAEATGRTAPSFIWYDGTYEKGTSSDSVLDNGQSNSGGATSVFALGTATTTEQSLGINSGRDQLCSPQSRLEKTVSRNAATTDQLQKKILGV